MDPVREVKTRAEILHRRIQAGDAEAVARLRVLPEHRRKTEGDLSAAAASIQRKHCLAAVSLELGFSGFEHARRVLDGAAGEADFGKLLYFSEGGARLNIWCASHAEARAILRDAGDAGDAGERRYLLAYQRHFFLADRHFIEALGLDPDDPDWEAIGWDWARPRVPEARRRLYGKLLAARRPGGA